MPAPELERRSPLAGQLVPGDWGTASPDGPGVTVTERRGLSLVQATVRMGQEPQVAERLGLDPAPGRASTTAFGTALWLAPGTWLVMADGQAEGILAAALREHLAGLAAVVDQSHGRVVLRLAGPCARQVLEKGWRLDLHPRAFRPGMCAQSAIAHIPTLLHQLDPGPTYDLLVPSGYALSFLDWLTLSSAALGYRVGG